MFVIISSSSNVEKSVEIGRTRYRQAGSVNRAERRSYKASNRRGMNVSFTSQRKGSRAISALDAKLNAIQRIIYDAKKIKKRIAK
jgi:hypothetical protein